MHAKFIHENVHIRFTAIFLHIVPFSSFVYLSLTFYLWLKVGIRSKVLYNESFTKY